MGQRRLFNGDAPRASRSLPPEIRSTAVRKLDMLNAASDLKDLRVLPGNRLEALKGDLRGCTASGSTISGGCCFCGMREMLTKLGSLTTTEDL